MGTDWLVGRVDMYGGEPADCMPPGIDGSARQAEITALVAALGLDPAAHRHACVFTQNEAGYAVHFSEFLLRDGQKFVDYVEDRAATRPVTRAITREQLPSWLRPPE